MDTQRQVLKAAILDNRFTGREVSRATYYTRAPVKSAPPILAPNQDVSSRKAPRKLAPCSLDKAKLARFRKAPSKFAPFSEESWSCMPSKKPFVVPVFDQSLPSAVMPAKFASARLP